MISNSGPVFVIGSPRSGTSILPWSLAQHRGFWTSLESDLLFNLFGRGHVERAYEKATSRPEGSWLVAQGVDRAEFMRHLGMGLDALFSSRSQGKRWVDQTPVNTLLVDVLAEMFPSAKFIHILRDGRRVVHSMVHFLDGVEPAVRQQVQEQGRAPSWALDFATACMTWREYVTIATRFAQAQPSRCLTVTNEGMVRDPQGEFDRIFKFLGVEHEDAPAEYFRGNRINSSFSAQPVKAVRKESPWEKWTPAQRSIFVECAGATMIEMDLAKAEEFAGVAPMEDPTRAAVSVVEPAELHEQVQTLADLLVERQAQVDGLKAALSEFQAAAIGELVAEVTPDDAVVAVVSRGDEALLQLGARRRGVHFPRGEDGRYSGHYPADDAEAVAHLEALRREGAQYLLLPSTSLWWLDHYKQFTRHLERIGRRVIDRRSTCRMYALDGGAPAPGHGQVTTPTQASMKYVKVR